MSNTNPTSPQANNLDAATIQAAELLSAAAYDSLSGVSTDPNVLPLENTDGWTQVSESVGSNLQGQNNYQGIAFYKTIDGVTQVIIANRGTNPLNPTDDEMDWDIALHIQPPSDTEAQAYYAAVVHQLTTVQGLTNLNVIETGHSLGGQEADYVMSQAPIVPTEAVTFDAPGIGPAAQSAGPHDAVNLSNVLDLIHRFGGTYSG